MKHVKEEVIRDLYDVANALTEHSHNIFVTNKMARRNKFGLGLVFLGGLIFGIYEELRIRNMEARLDDTYENTKVQDQLDAQEEKILQLEMELEDLKKKE